MATRLIASFLPAIIQAKRQWINIPQMQENVFGKLEFICSKIVI